MVFDKRNQIRKNRHYTSVLTTMEGGCKMPNLPYTIDEIRTKVIPIAIRYNVDTLSLFGSYARGDADEKSDLDFLIQKGRMKGLLSYCGMVADLEDIFHCHVDLVMKNAIKDPKFLEEIDRNETGSTIIPKRGADL